MAPESIWHRTQFGTKGVKGSIWHRPVVLCLGTLTSPMRVETFFQWTFISNIRGLFGFVLRGRVKIINTGLFLPTFEEGTVCVVSGGPYGPNRGNKYSSIPDCYCQQHKGERKSYILDCFCQHLRRLLLVLCLGDLAGQMLLVPNWPGAKLGPVPN